MSRKNISKEKIIQAFLTSAFDKSAGATSLADISECLEIKKASLYNHFENRDAMYEATVEFCMKEILSISFLTDKILETIKNGKTSINGTFKKLTSRFLNLYESEPLFQMYVFIQTEKYFYTPALECITAENEKITDEIKRLLSAFAEVGRFPKKSEKEFKEIAQLITTILIQRRDFYVSMRKETIRQNPESGVGSLFALPPDEQGIALACKSVEQTIGLYSREK